MFLRSLLVGALCVASADAFGMGGMPLAPTRMVLRTGACSSLRMIDWSTPEPPGGAKPSGAGSDRGQINQSDKVYESVESRLAEAKRIAAERGIGSKSGLDPEGKYKEGDRDPVTGRLILDPLKIPTSEQGAPGSWEEYMKMRKAKEGTVKDAFGNNIEGVKPSAPIQAGTWGPPKDVKDTNVDDLFTPRAGDVKITEIDKEQEEWKRKKDQERAAEDAEVEARMQKWLADAAAKKAQGGQ
eukprot:CAMPEP_0206243574 /NCGR_PEP_ID=MMETSP0047_2-20121206/17678_1 /ASSEMBLY_ACC=CAM_ASM_000192 /TAXON_ID=195065 /ORGANISM="Chroomonas mesostigmatica_cf, Strain CCMP1168" /LENGTH=240 /DNA_ID=CAMNT_0053668699 /DNA_START=12 /DNA_END=734 /DNA_ORIENTATION=+